MSRCYWPLALSVLCLSTLSLQAAGPVYTDPEKADADFRLQGEYEGQLPNEGGTALYGVQVIARGNGKFEAVAYIGGLPGAGWNGETPQRISGEKQNGEVVFRGEGGKGVLRDGVITALSDDGNTVGTLQRIERRSPTLGLKPPEDAVVLFDGRNTEQWKDGKLSSDGLLMPGTTSVPTFADHRIHIEFRLPYQPEDEGQARGNSGIYLQGRYEVQMLDSFGLEGKQNECGGIYSVKDPDVNMCLPPLAWQTYDIDYRAARYNADGQLTENPRVTVRHNGVVIHNNVELPGDRNTTAAPVAAGPEPGPIYLQDHGNPVRYRHIWVVSQ